MKNSVYFSIILLFFLNISASAAKKIDANLLEAKVFLNGAELIHHVKADVTKGSNEIIITKIADNINERSIQVTAGGNVTIISVTPGKNYLADGEKPTDLLILEDSLKILKRNIDLLNSEKEVSLNEIELLNANRNIGGSQGISVAELQKQIEFFRKRLTSVKNDIINIEDKINQNKKAAERIQKQINEMNPNKNPENEIIINLIAERNTTIDIDISYLTYQAGWNPLYDLRAGEGSTKLELNYRANVWQRSGIDWNDCQISLSTRNPNEGGTKPELYPWYLNFLSEQKIYGAVRNQPAAAALKRESEVFTVESDEMSLADFTGITQTQLAVEFRPAVKYSIPSDGKPQLVSLQDYELDADFSHYAAPKLDKDAFMIASIKDWEELNLLPGSANIYYGNSFVGTSYIDPFTTSDSLIFSFGRDKNLVIERKILKDYQEDKFLSGDVERFFAYRIDVRNTGNRNVTLTLEEPFPISQTEDIEINLIEWDDAVVNRRDGKFTWTFELKPNESVAKKFVFSVRYPADKRIGGL